MEFAEILSYILSGAGVGLAIGLTGIGGGSLMTPLLIMFGFPFAVAIGTDLLYAAITKANGVFLHHRKQTINWRIVYVLGLGSLPSSLLTAYALKKFFHGENDYEHILTLALGSMLILTAFVILFKDKIQTALGDGQRSSQLANFFQSNSTPITFFAGIFLGVFVTLSSVGAGAFGTALLMVLYPKLRGMNIIGTDLAHAVPLTLIAGLGHLFFLNTVDLQLLMCLLIGSLPAIYIGTHLSSKMPEKLLKAILGIMLLLLGIKFAFF